MLDMHGKWKVVGKVCNPGENLYVIDSNGDYVCTCSDHPGLAYRAAVIANAPQMHQVMKAMRAWVEDELYSGNSVPACAAAALTVLRTLEHDIDKVL